MKTFDHLMPLSTVRLNGIIGGQVVSYGTGFFYLFNDTLLGDNNEVDPTGQARIGIVTNKHVLEGMEEIQFHFNTVSQDESEKFIEVIKVIVNNENVIAHPEDDIDLCVILTHHLVELLNREDKKISFHPVRKALRISEEQIQNMGYFQNLVMIGYPNGLWDHVNNLPIVRTGTNATALYQNYLGKDDFAVDIATYRGSSGSPIFIYDQGNYIEDNQFKFGHRYFFVGIIKQAHLRSYSLVGDLMTEEMLHIGIAIKAHKLDVFEDLIRQHYEGT